MGKAKANQCECRRSSYRQTDLSQARHTPPIIANTQHEIPAGARPAYGEALEVAQRLALDGFLRLSRTLQGPGSAAPLVALQLQPGDVAEAVRKGRPKGLYELLPAELRQWHGR